MNNDLTCSCSCTPDSTPTDTSPDFLYAHQSPYPPVCIKEQNPLYGRMMLDNMGGQESEMSTIGLYIYNSIFLTSDTARIAEIFKNISIVEMHHLKIFGQLADQLGESPRCGHIGKIACSTGQPDISIILRIFQKFCSVR